MNLGFLSLKALETLKNAIPSNRASYLEGKANTILAALPTGSIVESRLIVGSPPSLVFPVAGQLMDGENARIIFSWLSTLSPVEASDPRLWAFLTHSHYCAYTAARWPIPPDSDVEEVIGHRYFVLGHGLESTARNSIARLWWAAHLTYDQNRVDPFELTQVLLSLQDIQQAFLERALGRSKVLLQTCLQLWKSRLEGENTVANKGKAARTWAKLIRLHGAVVILDSLPAERLRNLLWVKLASAFGEELDEFGEEIDSV